MPFLASVHREVHSEVCLYVCAGTVLFTCGLKKKKQFLLSINLSIKLTQQPQKKLYSFSSLCPTVIFRHIPSQRRGVQHADTLPFIKYA